MEPLSLEQQPIYVKQIITRKIKIPFSKLYNSVEDVFKEHAKKFIQGKCCKEGYISPKYIKIIEYSAPIAISGNVVYDVAFEFEVYYPFEGQEVSVRVTNITKIGIKAVISQNENKNPITVFASRIHNPHVIMKDDNIELNDELANDNEFQHIYSEGDVIKVKVIGCRFEQNDASVSVLGEIIK